MRRRHALQHALQHVHASTSRLSSRHVIVDDNLEILVRLDFDAPRVVTRQRLWVYVDHLTIALVFEEEPGLIVGDHLEVGGGV